MAIWQENKPGPNDIPNASLPSLITGNKTVLSAAIGKHVFWTDSSTASIGVPRLSDGSLGPGSARAYVDTRSNLSVPISPAKTLSGRLYIDSVTSQLYGYIAFTAGPLGTSAVPLGGANAVVYQTGSQATIANNTRVLVQISAVSIVAIPGGSGSSTGAVTFGTQYNVAPQVQVMPVSADTTTLTFAAVTSITTSGFSLALRSLSNTTFATNVFWRSHGTVPF